MAKQRSTVSKFKSPSTGDYCTLAQYIAEVLVQRKSQKDNKGSLAYKFWNKNQKKSYESQIVSVNRLIKEFGEDVVYSYIIKENTRIYSVGVYQAPKWIKEGLAKHKKLLDRKPKTQKQITDATFDPTSKPRKAFGKKTLFSKLRKSNGENKD